MRRSLFNKITTTVAGSTCCNLVKIYMYLVKNRNRFLVTETQVTVFL